jgi:hypothetical protein
MSPTKRIAGNQVIPFFIILYCPIITQNPAGLAKIIGRSKIDFLYRLADKEPEVLLYLCKYKHIKSPIPQLTLE